jgi:hypothetical protein
MRMVLEKRYTLLLQRPSGAYHRNRRVQELQAPEVEVVDAQMTATWF